MIFSTRTRAAHALILLGSICSLCAPAFAERSVPVSADIASKADTMLSSSAEAVNQAKPLTISFQLKGDDAGLDTYVAQLSDPKSPNYHKWLTPTEVGVRFGASLSDIADVANWAKSNGFKITDLWQNRRFVTAQATKATVESAFGVSLHSYARRDDKSSSVLGSMVYFAPDSLPVLPASIAAKVSYIGGLSSGLQAIAHSVKLATAKPAATANATPLSDPLTPSQLSVIYDAQQLQTTASANTALSIGIFSPVLYKSSDVTSFESIYDITAPAPIEKWPSSTGRTTDSNSSDEEESALDTEIIMGQAPKAQIVLYEAPNDGTSPPVEFMQMEQDDLPVISVSYTFAEVASNVTALQSIDLILKTMAAQGQTICCASGDSGPYDDPSQPSAPIVGYPASSTYALGVGGTTLPTSLNGSWASEVAWNDNTGESGGGLSTLFARPSWQTGPGVQNNNSDGERQVPDVAAIAGAPGVDIYTNGSLAAFGGTSISTPVWASAFLLMDQASNSRFGNPGPLLYPIANVPSEYQAAFHDITSGSDQLFSATTGWDYMTGLGSADFNELYLTLSHSPIVYAFASGLQMISAPYNYGSAPLASIFSTAPTLAVWQPTSSSYAVTPSSPADSLVPGQGYWVRVGQALNLTSSGISSPSSSTAFDISLATGWNMIGDPFTTNVPVTSCSVINSANSTLSYGAAGTQGLIGTYMFSYDPVNQEYEAVGQSANIVPYQGYWIYASSPCTFVVP